MRLTTGSFRTGLLRAAYRVGRFKHWPTIPLYMFLLVTAVMIVVLFYMLGACAGDRSMHESESVRKAPQTHPSNAVMAPIHFAYGARSATGCPAFIAGSHDATSQLNTWLATVSDGMVIEFAPSACYRLDQTLLIRGHRNLTLEGNGATFKRVAPTPAALLYPKTNPHFLVEDGTELTLRNFRIEGLNTVNSVDPWVFDPGGFGSGFEDKAFESGIAIRSVNRITIADVQIDAVFGDGITVGSELAQTCTSDVSIKSVSIDRNGRQGIAVVFSNQKLIHHLQVLHSHGTGIDLEPNGVNAHVEHLEIRHSYLNARTITISSTGTYDISNVSVHDNTLAGWSPAYPWLCVCGPDTSHRHDWNVQNNRTLRGAVNRSTVKFLNVVNVTFDGNVSISSGGHPVASVELSNVTGVVRIVNNSFPGAPVAYLADATTGPVLACGNQLSGQQGTSPC